jgi:hypothetical protein
VISPDGTFIAAKPMNGTLELIDTATFEPFFTDSPNDTCAVTDLRIRTDGAFVFASCFDYDSRPERGIAKLLEVSPRGL